MTNYLHVTGPVHFSTHALNRIADRVQPWLDDMDSVETWVAKALQGKRAKYAPDKDGKHGWSVRLRLTGYQVCTVVLSQEQNGWVVVTTYMNMSPTKEAERLASRTSRVAARRRTKRRQST